MQQATKIYGGGGGGAGIPIGGVTLIKSGLPMVQMTDDTVWLRPNTTHYDVTQQYPDAPAATFTTVGVEIIDTSGVLTTQRGVCYGGGYLWVCNSTTVYRLNYDGSTTGFSFSLTGQTSVAQCLTWGKDELIVGVSGSDNLLRYSTSGSYLSGNITLNATYYTDIKGAYFDAPSNLLWVVGIGTEGEKVCAYDYDTTDREIDFAMGSNVLNGEAQAITLLGGLIVVANTTDDRIYCFDTEGTAITDFATASRNIYGLSTHPDGRLAMFDDAQDDLILYNKTIQHTATTHVDTGLEYYMRIL